MIVGCLLLLLFRRRGGGVVHVTPMSLRRTEPAALLLHAPREHQEDTKRTPLAELACSFPSNRALAPGTLTCCDGVRHPCGAKRRVWARRRVWAPRRCYRWWVCLLGGGGGGGGGGRGKAQMQSCANGRGQMGGEREKFSFRWGGGDRSFLPRGGEKEKFY